MREQRGGGIKRYLHMEIPARGRGVEGNGGGTQGQMDAGTDGRREGAGGPLTDPLTTRQGGSAALLTQQRVCP